MTRAIALLAVLLSVPAGITIGWGLRSAIDALAGMALDLEGS